MNLRHVLHLKAIYLALPFTAVTFRFFVGCCLFVVANAAKPPWIVQVWAELWCRQLGDRFYSEPRFVHTIRCSGTLLSPNLVLTAGRCFAVPDDFLGAKSVANCSTEPFSRYSSKTGFNNLTIIEPRHIRVYLGDGRTWRKNMSAPFVRNATSSWQADEIFLNPEFAYYSRVFPYDNDDDVAYNDMALLRLALPSSDDGRIYPKISDSDDNNCYDDCQSSAWNYLLSRDPHGDATQVETRSGSMRLEMFRVISREQDFNVRTSATCLNFLQRAKDYRQVGNSANPDDGTLAYYYYRCYSSWVPRTNFRNVSNKYPLLDHGCHFDIGAPLMCKNRRRRNGRFLVTAISISNQCQWLYYRHRRIGVFQNLAPHYDWIVSILRRTQQPKAVMDRLYSFLNAAPLLRVPPRLLLLSAGITSLLVIFNTCQL